MAGCKSHLEKGRSHIIIIIIIIIRAIFIQGNLVSTMSIVINKGPV